MTNAIDNLVQCVENGVPYEDLQTLKAYIQWTIDHAAFEAELRSYRDRLQVAHEEEVRRARADFKQRNGLLTEQVLWDWCPVFRVLRTFGEILHGLPPFPWRHDSESAIHDPGI